MIDPKTLKEDDVVVFGGNSEAYIKVKRVNYHSISTTREEYDVIDFSSPIWKVAELRKLTLPVLSFHARAEGGYRYAKDYGTIYSPSTILRRLKGDVERLEAAGVRETE